jgi:hypothetical protein
METRVYHKVGALDNLLCDVGIVDDGKDQILNQRLHPDLAIGGLCQRLHSQDGAQAYNALRENRKNERRFLVERFYNPLGTVGVPREKGAVIVQGHYGYRTRYSLTSWRLARSSSTR